MSHRDTPRRLRRLLVGFVAVLYLALPGFGQFLRPEWRQVGNSLQLLSLPGPASGPIERVWFGADGSLLVRLASGGVYATSDLETWAKSAAQPPDPLPAPSGARLPEASASLRTARSSSPVVYAAGSQAWRSEDGGLHWRNLTALSSDSILGARLADLAVDPSSEERIAAANAYGVWVSIDSGLTWRGVNEGLPALRIRRILSAPAGSRLLRIAVDDAAQTALSELEWLPGQRQGWLASSDRRLETEAELRLSLSAALETGITAVAASGDVIYAGAAGGRLYASLDAGLTWRSSQALPAAGQVQRIWLDPADSRFALAVLASTQAGAPQVLRTLNGGSFWDDLTADLPAGPAYGVAADRASGSIYVATAAGLFATATDLRAPVPATPWRDLSAGLPAAAVRDVRLDDSGNILLAAVDGYGVFSSIAPHRARRPALVHTASFLDGPAAPGALISLVGSTLQSAEANNRTAPVFSSQPSESQLQVPFDASGDRLQLVLRSGGEPLVMGMPLEAVAPAIFVDRDDGAPFVLDLSSGTQVDAMHPARSGSSIQVFMTGLGRVRPDWPTGMPAPLEDTPRVLAQVRATLDGQQLEVLRATLAPGYIGYYLVELRLPELVDSGAQLLVVEAGGRQSNPVRLYLAQ